MAIVKKNSFQGNMPFDRSRMGTVQQRQKFLFIICGLAAIMVFHRLIFGGGGGAVGADNSYVLLTDSNNDGSHPDLEDHKMAGSIFTKDRIIDQKQVPESVMKKAKMDPSNVYMFQHTARGKSGKVIQDMLIGHNYAWQQQMKYGGSCGEEGQHHEDHVSLLKALGLEDELPFRCSRDLDPAQYAGVRAKTIPKAVYQDAGASDSWTLEYVNYLKQVVHKHEKADKRFTVSVHVRRDKNTPCRGTYSGFAPYLSNAHYIRLIDDYTKDHQTDARVIIFSTEKSHESHQDFIDRGYEVYLENDLPYIWETMVSSDVLIMSRSDFVFPPAVVAQGKVVYTPYWHKPLPGWEIVPENYLRMADAERESLKSTCPQKKKFGKRKKDD